MIFRDGRLSTAQFDESEKDRTEIQSGLFAALVLLSRLTMVKLSGHKRPGSIFRSAVVVAIRECQLQGLTSTGTENFNLHRPPDFCQTDQVDQMILIHDRNAVETDDDVIRSDARNRRRGRLP